MILKILEKKLINRIKSDMIKAKIESPLYVIHNLKTFVTKMEVENYINNTLLKCATFELEESILINTKLVNLKENIIMKKEEKFII